MNERVFEAFYKSFKEKQLIVYFVLFKESMKLFANWTRIRKGN
ncbi:hypothetical protein B4144_2042 [Bacillus atrophaeus]|nr:hypothetical protein B4144_2042 [Bacillus atrophaeus]